MRIKKYLNCLIILLLTISIVMVSPSVYSQEQHSINPNKLNIGYPVKLGGEVLFYIKNSTEKLSAAARAQQISNELKNISRCQGINLDKLDISSEGENRVISLTNFIVTLTPKDFKSESKDRAEVESDYLEILKKGIKKYRENNKYQYRELNPKSFEVNPETALLTVSVIFVLFMMVTVPLYSSKFRLFINNFKEILALLYQKTSTLPVLKRISYTGDDEFFKKYKIGGLDNKGKLILDIYHYTDYYIIYRTSKVVQWLVNDEKDESKKYKRRVNKILYLLAKIESQNPEEISKAETVNRLIAKGIKLSLENESENNLENGEKISMAERINSLIPKRIKFSLDDERENNLENVEKVYTDAEKVLIEAEQRLKIFRANNAKLQYLIASFYETSLIIFMIGSLTAIHMLFQQSFLDIIKLFDIPISFLIVISCGTLGGFLSIASGINKVSIDPDDDYSVAGISRILIALISSLIIYITLKANIFPEFSSFFLENPSNPDIWRVAFISVSAGFTESFVPNLLKLKKI